MNVGPKYSKDNDIIQSCDKHLKSQNCFLFFFNLTLFPAKLLVFI